MAATRTSPIIIIVKKLDFFFPESTSVVDVVDVVDVDIGAGADEDDVTAVSEMIPLVVFAKI